VPIRSIRGEPSRLLADVYALKARQSLDASAAFTQAFEKLRRDWATLRQRRFERERTDAPRHNLIRFLSLHRAEIGFHSPFLCDLLDPWGSHGQGSLFLRSFLEMIGKKAHDYGADWNYQLVDTDSVNEGDWIVLGESGKIDISVRNRTQRVLIFIENKIDAREQVEQLTRYRERLEGERYSYDHRLLAFLSPRSYEPSTVDRGNDATRPHHCRGPSRQSSSVL
jgi:hypothetical protein